MEDLAVRPDYRKRLNNLPDHDQKSIDVAADQMDMLEVSFNTGTLDIELKRIRKSELLQVIDKIEAMTTEELRAGWMFEPPFDPQDPKGWTEQAKRIRIAYLCEQFELISRLRDDEPEAWDEINELYFDD